MVCRTKFTTERGWSDQALYYHVAPLICPIMIHFARWSKWFRTEIHNNLLSLFIFKTLWADLIFPNFRSLSWRGLWVRIGFIYLQRLHFKQVMCMGKGWWKKCSLLMVQQALRLSFSQKQHGCGIGFSSFKIFMGRIYVETSYSSIISSMPY